jgi:aldehyde:ferredoxin oxidoreductase
LVGGYAGATLWINLSSRELRKLPLDYDLARRYLGGRGLAAKMLFDQLGEGIDALQPENVLIFATGPLTGVAAPGANRTVIVTKSPETGIFLDTYAGGHLGPEIKFAGYDVIVVRGRSDSPVYVRVEDDEVSLTDASHLWGKDCWETERLLKEEMGDEDARTAVIGPAGERLVKFACVSTDYFHQFGRGGAGAVMGSKNLKGIAVRGTKPITVAHPEALLDYVQNKIEWIFTQGPNAQIVKDRIKYGTPLTMDFTQPIGILPTKNFQLGKFERFEEIDGLACKEKIFVADKACYSCNTPCTKFSEVKTGPYSGTAVVGPEYETNALFGSNIGNSSLEAIVKGNVICDRLGMDTVSAGNVIGFVMECYEKGILSKTETDGLDLRFGNVDAAFEMLDKIACRDGVGNLLAEGVRSASQAIKKGSEKFAMQCKGMEYPAYEPRGSPAFALLYATCDRGACHRRGWPVIVESTKYKPNTTEGRPQLVKDLYDDRTILHSAIVCDLPYNVAGIGQQEMAKIFSLVTGWEVSPSELQVLADRVASLVRSFNVVQGMSRADDTLPPRTMEEPLIGPSREQRITKEMLSEMLDQYYALRGWDIETGIPLTKTLQELNLNEIENNFERTHGTRQGKWHE